MVTGGLFRYRVWTNADVHDDNPWFLFSRTDISCTRHGLAAELPADRDDNFSTKAFKGAPAARQPGLSPSDRRRGRALAECESVN